MRVTTLNRLVIAAIIVVGIAGVTTRAWNVAINGRPTSDLDNAMSVAVDPETGSVFVAGRRQVSSSLSQFFVVKFAADGREQWREVVEGNADIGLRAGAVAVAVDSAGFVFVAGTIGNSESAADFVVMKIDGRSAAKRVLWTRVVDGLGFDDSVNAVALTPDGGIAIAGLVSVASGAHKFYLMKFAADGLNAWPAPQILTGTAPGGLNAATAVGTLPNGDVAVTGYLTNAESNADLVVGRFDGTTGQGQWFVTVNDSLVNGQDIGSALSVAPNGDIVAGGTIQPAGFHGSDFAVFRFTGAGQLRWRSVVDRGFFDALRSLAVAPNGDVIASGTLEPASGSALSSFFVISLDAAGRERWRYERPGSQYFLEARAVGFDRDGNPVATGQTEGTAAALSTFTVIAFDRNAGTVLWDVPIVGTAPFSNAGVALASDTVRDAVVAAGVTQNDRTSLDMAVISITDGQENWSNVITGRGERLDREDAALAIAVDPQRKTLALAGYTQNTGATLFGTPHEFRVLKIHDSGTPSWSYDFRDPLAHVDNAALSLAADLNGDFFAAGRTCSAGGKSCFTVVRIGKNGKELWRTIIPGLSQGRDEARAIIRDPQDGNVIVAGTLRVAAGSAFAVFKLDAGTGTILWPAVMSHFPFGTADALALTSRGTVAVAGIAEGRFAVLEFDTSTGAIVSRAALPGSGHARSVAFDASQGTVVAGGSLLSAQLGLSEMVVAKFDGTGQVMWQSASMGFTGFGDAPVTVAIHQESGEIAAVGEMLSGAFTAFLLDPHGQEQWRNDDIQGTANSVAFAGTDVVAVGSFREGTGNVFAVVSWAHDGAERWRRAFRGTADFEVGSAAGLVVKERGVFAAGVITNNLTYTDMFAVGLGSDGHDLPGGPGVQPTAAPSIRQSLMRKSRARGLTH